MVEEGTLKDEVKKLNENFDKLLESGKVKGFKPNKKLTNANVKKNYTLAIVIGENREIKFIKVPISEGTVIVDGIPRLATTDYALSYKGKPAIIIPEWSTKPFSPVENYEDTVKSQMTAAGYKLLLNRIELGKIALKKKMSGMIIILIILALIVGGYLLYTR
jgi:hypothetical protein